MKKEMKVLKELKITVVTPVYNGEKYIEQCIRSIMNQTYRNFEHIIMDGGSEDCTVEIARKYEKEYDLKIISRKDNGMYDAIASGFAMAEGDILCWLNADDMFMPWAFEVMQSVIAKTDAQWCMGFPTYWNGEKVNRCQYRISTYSQSAIKRGLHDGRVLPFIQQESCFWTKDLWLKANGKLIKEYNMAGDFQLWKAFASHATLYKINSPIAGFRQHTGQKSEDKEKYYKEVDALNLWKKIFIKTKVLKIMDALLSLRKGKDRLLIQELF